MKSCAPPRGLLLDEVPAPKRLAPFTAALTAETAESEAGTPLATGRLVVLHDPAGQDAWDGDFRLVVMARTRLDRAMGSDEALGSAAWSWLTDALDDEGAGYRCLVGTVTRVASETFGGMTLTDSSAHAEIRASWTPMTPNLGPHLSAWYRLIHMAAGHEPASAPVVGIAGAVVSR